MFGPQSQLGLFPADDGALAPARAGSQADVNIRESSRARRLSIKVYPRGKVEVVVPRRTRPADVASFVEQNRDWIARTRESFAHNYAADEFELPQHISLPATGNSYEIRYRSQAAATTVRYRCADGKLTLTGRVGDDAQCLKAIRRWLAETARAEMSPWLLSLSARTGIPYQRLQIRAQKTCWGSRSSSGTISLNLCLMFLEPRLVRYLMLHELCHGRHMDHSRRFWALVGRFEADFRRLDKELGESWRRIPPWLDIY